MAKGEYLSSQNIDKDKTPDVVKDQDRRLDINVGLNAGRMSGRWQFIGYPASSKVSAGVK